MIANLSALQLSQKPESPTYIFESKSPDYLQPIASIINSGSARLLGSTINKNHV